MSGVLQAVFQNQRSFGTPAGQQAYTTAGTYSWVCPTGVTSISVVMVGSGGGYSSANFGGGGGGLGYKNNISVTPGTSYTVVVGAYDISTPTDSKITVAGTDYIAYSGVNRTGGGKNANCDGGGTGGTGGTGSGASSYYCGGGGAGGYSGNGGNGANGEEANGIAGAGGGGGGGSGGGSNGGKGGSVGLFGEGASGAQGTYPGGGGFANGGDGSVISGAIYAGGGSGYFNSGSLTGAVRIIWAGTTGVTRTFPSTNTGDL